MACDGSGTLGCAGCPVCRDRRERRRSTPTRTFPIPWFGNEPLPPNWGQIPEPAQEF